MGIDDAACGMCDDVGEIDVTAIEEYGCVPCPECVSREAASRLREMRLVARVLLQQVQNDMTQRGLGEPQWLAGLRQTVERIEATMDFAT